MRKVFESGSAVVLYELQGDGRKNGKVFHIDGCIGAGATGVAYNAHDNSMVPYRLKNCRPDDVAPSDDEYASYAERYKRAYNQQVSLLAGDTQNITSSATGLYADDGGTLWSSTSGLVGRTFSELMDDVPAETHLSYMLKICEALKAYHESGWLLLDLKPDNILIVDSLGISGVSFFDFDSFLLKRDIREAAESGKALPLSGTDRYSAPELLQGDLPLIGDSSDAYSAGAVLFRALLGREPELTDSLGGFDLSGVNLPETCLREIREFLSRTLDPNPARRYGSDDEMLLAMRRITELSASKRLTIMNMMPKAVGSFTGREKEIDELGRMLVGGMAPVFVTGEGGIGKTQFVLKAAEALKKEGYTFYFTQYKGSVRETLLNLDAENEEEYADDESRFNAVISSLSHYGSRDVLILDNFDAADEKNTVLLTDDEDYSLLVKLPIHIIFTTRTSFESENVIGITSLRSDELSVLMGRILPDAGKELFEDIEYAFGRNTLLSVTVCSLLKSGRIKASDVKRICRSRGSLYANAEYLVKRTRLNRAEKEILSAASCLPVRGVYSDIWFAVLGEARYKSSFELADCGLLQDSGGIWNMHSLLRDAFTKSRHIGRYLKAAEAQVKAAEKSDVGGIKRLQLAETGKSIRQIRHYYKKTAAVEATALLSVAAIVVAGYVSYCRSRDSADEAKSALRLKEAEYLAELADREYDSGNVSDAVYLAAQALPSEDSGLSMPPKAQFLLENALGCYSLDPATPQVTATYKHDSDIGGNDIFFDDEDHLLFTCDGGWTEGFSIYIWDTEEDELYYRENTADETISLFQEKLLDSEKDLLMYASDSNLTCFDYISQQNAWKLPLKGIRAAAVSPETDSVWVITDDSILRIDETAGRIAETVSLGNITEDSLYITDEFDVSADGRYVAFVLNYFNSSGEFLGDHNAVFYDSQKGTFVFSEKRGGIISELCFLQNGNLLVSSIEQGGTLLDLGYSASYRTQIVSLFLVQAETGKTIWKHEDSHSGMMSDPQLRMIAPTKTQPERCIWFFGTECRTIDAEGGSILHSVSIPGTVVAVRATSESKNGKFYAFTRDGGMHSIDTGDGSRIYTSLFNTNDVTELQINQGYYICCRSDESVITKYQYVTDENFVLLKELGDDFYRGKSFLGGGICAVTNIWYPGQANLLVWTDTESDETHRVELKAVEEFSIDLEPVEILGVSNVNGNRELIIRSTEKYSDGEEVYLVYVNLDTGESRVECAPAAEQDNPSEAGMHIETGEGRLRVWDENGQLIFKTAYDSRVSAVCTEIVREGNGLLVVYSDGKITDYNLSDGTVLNSLDNVMNRIEESNIRYIDEDTVACFVSGGLSTGGIIVLDISEETWGQRSSVPYAFEYDIENDRFYVKMGQSFGYFPRYNVNTLISMADERW